MKIIIKVYSCSKVKNISNFQQILIFRSYRANFNDVAWNEFGEVDIKIPIKEHKDHTI